MYQILKRIILIIPWIGIYVKVSAQVLQQGDEILYWTKNNQLTLDDFRGLPSREDTILSGVSTKNMTHKLGAIIKGIDVLIKTEQGKTVFTIRAGMKKNLSWIKNYGDTISLKHEQGHFDICEIYARILRRDIKRAKSLSEAKEMFEKTTSDEEIEQGNYDKVNTFQSGGITPNWKQKILNRLKELESYKKAVVVVPIDN